MDREAILQFVSFLERVESNSIEIADVRAIFRPTLQQGYCLWNLYQEFDSAFSSEQGDLRLLHQS